MHVLWGLQQLGFKLELKGGTSLSKAHHIIERFSEDIDICIAPDEAACGFKVFTGKNHDKPKHIDSRRSYYDWVCGHLRGKIPGITHAARDVEFDDTKYRSGGIRLTYEATYPTTGGIKEGILLELGFGETTPNEPKTISSWAWDEASKFEDVFDNRAMDVRCYDHRYTFVEKLQTIMTKYRNFKDTGDTPKNFLRHYYDVYQLLDKKDVQAFIGSDEYRKVKAARFSNADKEYSIEVPFRLSGEDRARFEDEYQRTSSLYYRGQPLLSDILDRINRYTNRL